LGKKYLLSSKSLDYYNGATLKLRTLSQCRKIAMSPDPDIKTRELM